ncbi:MAG: ketoreductase and phosphopantetheine attachment site domain-containing protein [Pseudomonadales bacterium]|nr:ketoreductase and phosphopantetheine attachment site domain-containing protein [Pseudomonadales bacterium]
MITHRDRIDSVDQAPDQGVDQGSVQLLNTRQPTVASNGTYILTGGLGGLGIEVSEWLIQRGANNILLLGRRAPNTHAQTSIDRWKASGVNVKAVSVDICDYHALRDVINPLAHEKADVKGIFHLAGILDDKLFNQLNAESVAAVMAPKFQGAWNLHCLTKVFELDYFVSFSSVASVLGSPGQSNYAAANSALDGLMAHRRQQGLVGLTINWGPWAEVGMAADKASVNLARYRAMGLSPMPVLQGMDCLAQAMVGDQWQSLFIDLDWARYPDEMASLFVEDLLVIDTTKRSRDDVFLDQLTSAPTSQKINLLERYLMDQIASIMGETSSDWIEPKQRLFDLGLDSLMAVELKNKLQTALDIKLQTSLLFDYPTVESLVDYLAREQLDLSEPVPIIVNAANEKRGVSETEFSQQGEGMQSTISDLDSESLDDMSIEMMADLLSQEINDVIEGMDS